MHLFLFACHLPSSGTTIAINDMAVSKKKRSSSSCSDDIASAMSVEAHVVRLCAEFHIFPSLGDCAERCVYCAKGSKQLRGRARAQLRGNIGCNDRLNEWD